MPRLTNAERKSAEAFGFEFTAPPERESSRSSRYDEMWDAARALCESNPGTSLKVRTYGSSSGAYAEAKAINNSEHRKFKDGSKWVAVAAPSTNEEEVDEEGHALTALYLTYKG